MKTDRSADLNIQTRASRRSDPLRPGTASADPDLICAWAEIGQHFAYLCELRTGLAKTEQVIAAARAACAESNQRLKANSFDDTPRS